MGARSRRKGASGELELAHWLTGRGYPAERGRQYKGGPDSPDVVIPSYPSMHIECKRCERLRLHDAVRQAVADAGEKIPIVAHRRTGGEWLAILPLDDLFTLLERERWRTLGRG